MGDTKTQSSCGIKSMQRSREKQVVEQDKKEGIMSWFQTKKTSFDDPEYRALADMCKGIQHDMAYVDFGECPPECEAVDCEFGQWAEWSVCSCEKSTQERRRTVNTYATCGGKLCEGDAIISRPCLPE